MKGDGTRKNRTPVMSCREMAGLFEPATLRSLALMASLLHCLKDAVEVVGLRRLHRREFLVRHQLLFPEQLTDRQNVPVVEIGGAWRAERTGIAQQRLGVGANRLLERITLNVGDLGPVKGLGPKQPAGPGVRYHRVVELPVLVAHSGRLRTGVVEE